MRKLILVFIVMFIMVNLHSQITVNGETLYGNEWIDYNKQYMKIALDETAIYSLTYEDLQNNGFPAEITGSTLQLFNNGEQVAIYTSNDGIWSEDDFLMFYGKENDGEMDRYHYRTWELDQLNPLHSIYTNVRSYYLTWDNASQNNPRITQQENDLSGTLPRKKEFYYHKEEQVHSDRHWAPPSSVADIEYSSFIRTEGFGDGLKPVHSFDFEVTNAFDTPLKPRVDIRLGTNLSESHILEFEVNGKVLDRDEFSSLKVEDYSYSFENTDLSSNTNLKITGKGLSDNFIVAHTTLYYPREFVANNNDQFVFEREGNSFNDYYEIEDFRIGTINYAFDLENNTFLIPEIEGNTLKINIPQGGENRSDLFVIAKRRIKKPLSLELKNFTIMDDMNPEYLILTSERLNNSDNGDNPIQTYADFRASEKGGGYNVSVVNVEDIFDQFGYGIEGSGFSVRSFSNYMKAQWPDFQMVFIIGKSLDYPTASENNEVESYVPTYGNPGSDNLMFAEGVFTYPFVGVGRLAARDKQDVNNYLRKITRHSDLVDVIGKTVEERLWLKNIIHLSGGDDGLATSLFNHLEEMRDVIENGEFGAKVKTYRKTSSDPVQTGLSQEILQDIDEGLSMLTFFGHSSAGTFDFSVEDPSEYNNVGRLPVILSMGCNSGDIHKSLNELSLSEKMILTEDVGALAFIASSGSAFPTPLSRLGKDLYVKWAKDFYGQPIGVVNQRMAQDLYSETSVPIRTLQEQNTVHGDPAIQLYTAEGPDYVIDFSTVQTDKQVGATDEKVNLSFDIVNLGKAELDSIQNLLIHEYGDGERDSIYFKTEAPANRLSMELEINNPGFDAIGKNTINIILDINNKIQELPNPFAEDNNDMSQAFSNEGFCFFVFDNSAFPIYPKEFAIINKTDITLKASATNAFAKAEAYLLEIDTTENFDSPMLERGEVFSSPGLIEWDPAIQFENEVVYYWRISPKEMENTVWNTSSFVYLENSSEGWNQSHAYQWLKDDFTTMDYEEESRQFLFTTNINEVKIECGTHPGQDITSTILNTPFQYRDLAFEVTSGIYIAVFDKESGQPWLNQPTNGGLYGSKLITDWALNWGVFPFETFNPTNRYKVIQFLDDIVPDGNYVIMMTLHTSGLNNPRNGTPQIDEWASDAAVNPDGRDLMTLLQAQGASRLQELENESVPYIIAYKKNDPTFTPIEVVADQLVTEGDPIQLNLSIEGRWFEGDVNSTVIGPAQEWNRLQWSLDEFNLEEDEYQLDLIGIRPTGEEEVIFPNVDNFDFDLSFVNSDEFPNLKLHLYQIDDVSRTPVQMGYWRVLFKEKPEAVLNVNEKFAFESDTLFLGESLKLSTVATNISSSDMDSLLVKYTIVDNTNNEVNIFKNLPPLKAQETTDIDFEFVSDDLLGLHQFRVEINPEMAQPEQFLFNNIGIRDFVVQGDRINPILDVTIDGLHIMDGDIISPKPHIKIDLKDESEFLLIKDISSFDLALRKLPDNQPYPIDLSSSDIVFTPADSLSGNTATIDYYPELESGEYILFAQAEDVSGNLSGDQDVEIRFNVVEESQISNVLNYPNPFSTSTQFVFTLTGLDVPEVFTIQIMTLTGKVVREITKEELGNLRIGLNRTDFKWNGTDEYGSKLANGVYLYRVMTSTNNESFDHFGNEGIDGFFKKGFGKLVIMR